MESFVITFRCSLKCDCQKLFENYLHAFRYEEIITIEELDRFLSTHFKDVNYSKIDENVSLIWTSLTLRNYSMMRVLSVFDYSYIYRLYLPEPHKLIKNKETLNVNVTDIQKLQETLLQTLKEIKQFRNNINLLYEKLASHLSRSEAAISKFDTNSWMSEYLGQPIKEGENE